MSGRRVFFTADDFGASADVNEAVFRAYRDGLLRFASLMVTEPAAPQAAARVLKEFPGLRVGLHLVLCDGFSALGPGPWKGWVDAEGRFPRDPVRCGMRYFFDRSLGQSLEGEMRAQFERYLSFGLSPEYVDGHVNIHVHPVVFPTLVRLAREYGFSRVRLPGGELRSSASFSWKPLKQWKEAAMFYVLRRYLLRAYGDSRVAVLDRTYGLLRSGMMHEDYVRHALERLPPGDTEIYFHPTADPDSEIVDCPTPRHHTRTELQTLLSPSVKELVRERGIVLAGG